jgi:hypothetical protein
MSRWSIDGVPKGGSPQAHEAYEWCVKNKICPSRVMSVHLHLTNCEKLCWDTDTAKNLDEKGIVWGLDDGYEACAKIQSGNSKIVHYRVWIMSIQKKFDL